MVTRGCGLCFARQKPCWRWPRSSANAPLSTSELCVVEMVSSVADWVLGREGKNYHDNGELRNLWGNGKGSTGGSMWMIIKTGWELSRVHCAALLIVDIFEQLHNCFKVPVCRSGKKTTCLFHEEWVLQERGVSWSGMELVGSWCRRLRGEQLRGERSFSAGR